MFKLCFTLQSSTISTIYHCISNSIHINMAYQKICLIDFIVDYEWNTYLSPLKCNIFSYFIWLVPIFFSFVSQCRSEPILLCKKKKTCFRWKRMLASEQLFQANIDRKEDIIMKCNLKYDIATRQIRVRWTKLRKKKACEEAWSMI